MKDVLIITLLAVGTSFFSLANVYMWLLIRRVKAELKTIEETQGQIGDIPILDMLYGEEA